MVVTSAWFSAVIAVWSLLKEIYSLVITVLGLNDGILLEGRQFMILVHFWWGWDGFGFSFLWIDAKLSG
jgi:hypothetical protein